MSDTRFDAFEYVHSTLEHDIEFLKSDPRVLAEVRKTAYANLLSIVPLKNLAMSAVAASFEKESKADEHDLGALLSLLRSKSTIIRGGAALLLTLRWENSSEQTIDILAGFFQNADRDFDPLLKRKIRAWLESMRSKIASQLCDAAFPEGLLH